MALTSLILRHCFGLGDSVLLSALTRDIQLRYPGRFNIFVDCHFREVFVDHPYARPLLKPPTGPTLDLSIRYRDGIKASGRGQHIHMLAWYHLDFANKSGLALSPTSPKGCLHLNPEESMSIMPGQRYWVMMAGGKTDITNKWWWTRNWQETADRLKDNGITVVQAGVLHREHRHPLLRGVINTVNQLHSPRQFFNLIQHAEGVICPVTAAMHVAAVYDKPCVVISGGREEPWWEAYVNCYKAFGSECAPVKTEHRFLHTIGQLQCCQSKGCWKHRTVMLHDGRRQYDSSLCRLPVAGGDGKTFIAACMDAIKPEHVVEAVMSYYERGEIPPIGQPATPPEPVTREVTPVTPEVTIAGDHKEYRFARSDMRVIPPMFPPEADEPAKVVLNSNSPAYIDHPYIGGKFTVCVMCYGDHFDIAKKCLDSIVSTLPLQHLDLRVGLNAVCDQTLAYVQRMPGLTASYHRPMNDKKYPLMRKMFNDPDHPITSEYIVWFDDDTQVVDVGMWSQLCQTIVANHAHGVRMLGSIFSHTLSKPTARSWYTRSRWWRNRYLRVRGTQTEAPNGDTIQFVGGWFWALATHTMREAAIPDERIGNNGGDICIGEQVHQMGYKIKQFNNNKSLVWTPTRENGGRRGPIDVFPWLM